MGKKGSKRVAGRRRSRVPRKKSRKISRKRSCKPEKRTLIFLHGFSDGPSSFSSKDSGYFRDTKGKKLKNLRVVFPSAPYMKITSWGTKEKSWYDIIRDYGYEEGYPPSRPNEICKKSIAKTTRELVKLIKKEAKRYGGDTSRISIGGHSQGAMMAFHVLAHYKGKLGGFLGFLGYPTKVTDLSKLKQPAGPVHFVMGVDDTVMPIKWSKKLIEKATKVDKQLFLKKGIHHDNAWDHEAAWIRKWYKELLLFDKCPDLSGIGKSYLAKLPNSTLEVLCKNLDLKCAKAKASKIKKILEYKKTNK